tara:strand:- start:224 stop:904 length:681 start_codon:yes stop_codon:yes gene_type:complete
MKVGCVMLMSPGREVFQHQAVACYNSQTYTGGLRLLTLPADPARTIGAMRNYANSLLTDCDIVCHWDDDDWSHEDRIAEQVALLKATAADCVGYNKMLFWDQRPGQQDGMDALSAAWRYGNPNPRYALGTSLCYWRKAWEARPFPDLQHGEDTEWLKRVNCYAISAVPVYVRCPDDPPMIARIHSGNSSSAYDRAEMVRHNELPAAERQWVRAWGYDNFCREVMEC